MPPAEQGMGPRGLAITLRARSPWEAMDLGLAMLQRWWRLVYLPHLAVWAAMGAAAFALGAWLERPWVALVAIWWLKPVNDRVVLHVLSRAVFGERQGARTVLSQARQWLASGLFGALLLRWVPDMARSFHLPVRQLEGSRGRAARERRGVLGRRVHGHAVLLTAVCLAFEVLVIFLSLQLATNLLLPAKASEARDFWEAMFSGEAWSWGDALAYGLAVLALEPFYVAAGFGLYLNRRTLLEGWDIEMALRRIAERHAAAATLAACLFAGLGFLPGDSLAQHKDPGREIAEVLKAPEFPHEVERMAWRPIAKERETGSRDLDWLKAIGYAMASAARVFMWVGAAALLAYALWWVVRLWPRRGGAGAGAGYRPPEALFGMALAPETLPADVAAAALAAARAGRLREALGLLYRGALSELVHRRGVMLLSSHTEAEVLRLSPPQAASFMKDLIDAWQRSAYAKRDPAPAEIESLAQGYRELAA